MSSNLVDLDLDGLDEAATFAAQSAPSRSPVATSPEMPEVQPPPPAACSGVSTHCSPWDATNSAGARCGAGCFGLELALLPCLRCTNAGGRERHELRDSTVDVARVRSPRGASPARFARRFPACRPSALRLTTRTDVRLRALSVAR